MGLYTSNLGKKLRGILLEIALLQDISYLRESSRSSSSSISEK